MRHRRWWIVALICAGTVANYLARNSLGMTTQRYSYVVGAFQLAYTVMQPVAGFAPVGVACRWRACRMRRRRGLISETGQRKLAFDVLATYYRDHRRACPLVFIVRSA